MNLICADMEGIFTPEIWINVAEKTGIDELRLTTRDISDYDVLMQKRLAILSRHNLRIADIQAVIARMQPLEGALDFLNGLRQTGPVVLLSDTFTQFASPLLEKLGWPTLLCNMLDIAPDGSIRNYCLRQKDGKRMAILAFKSLAYRVVAVGDSYNDITMLKEADAGILFNPPPNVETEFSQFPVAVNYGELQQEISAAIKRLA